MKTLEKMLALALTAGLTAGCASTKFNKIMKNAIPASKYVTEEVVDPDVRHDIVMQSALADLCSDNKEHFIAYMRTLDLVVPVEDENSFDYVRTPLDVLIHIANIDQELTIGHCHILNFIQKMGLFLSKWGYNLSEVSLPSEEVIRERIHTQIPSGLEIFKPDGSDTWEKGGDILFLMEFESNVYGKYPDANIRAQLLSIRQDEKYELIEYTLTPEYQDRYKKLSNAYFAARHNIVRVGATTNNLNDPDLQKALYLWDDSVKKLNDEFSLLLNSYVETYAEFMQQHCMIADTRKCNPGDIFEYIDHVNSKGVWKLEHRGFFRNPTPN